MSDWLDRFVAESNRIEGIHREPLAAEIRAHAAFIDLLRPSVSYLEVFVTAVQPGAVLRDKAGLDVRVGSHIAPAGGPFIRNELEFLLSGSRDPYEAHLAYEHLHPFTDGNGRSGRVLWLWQMMRCQDCAQAQSLGFLHTFYYQTLRMTT